jgi:caa(3)-type oxidase subunit IV
MTDSDRAWEGRTYWIVYGWLIGLTILEVALVAVGWPKATLAILLVATALAKAIMIALYFMHLKFDPPAVWWLPGIPLILGALFVLALFPDIVFHLP